ncbi:MAG: LysM domain-containing protein [Ilumatobacteraceae bacterium]
MTATTPNLMPTFEVRFPAVGRNHSSHMVFMRRRLLVGLLFVALLAGLGLSARSVLADHGGVPASTPVVQPAISSLTASAAVGVGPHATTAPAPAAGTPYLVQPGESLWSIAESWHGRDSVADYVERLVDANGGASVQAGQLLTLP